jgi:polar amino acid transport system permease protein
VHYDFTLAPLWGYRFALLRAIWVTIEVSFLAIVFGTILGILLGLARHYGKRRLALYPLWILATIWIYVFISIPALVLLLWAYYIMPVFGVSLGSFWAAVLGLAVNLSPFAGEVFRSGLANVPEGELNAAHAMGYTWPQIIFLFILPQFFRNSVPPLMAQYYTTVKMSSLASVIGVVEIINVSQQAIYDTYRTLEVYLVVGLAYAVIVVPFAIVAKRYEDRVLIRRV